MQPDNESTITRTSGGLDYTAKGGKGGARSAPIVAGGTGCASMISPFYERDGLHFRPQDGNASERQFAIIAFVIGCATTDLYTNNHPVWKTQSHPAEYLIKPGMIIYKA